MISLKVGEKFRPDFKEAAEEMSKYSNLLCPPAPLYKRYVGNVTHGTLIDLAVGIDFLDGRNKFGGGTIDCDDADFSNYMVSVCRRFYTHLVSCLEMSCVEICNTRMMPINPSSEKFMEYIDGLLKTSQMSRAGKKKWRVYFDALRILRNKTSHSDSSIKPHELQVLQDARLDIHIGVGNRMQASVINFKPILERVLEFLDIV